MSADTTVALTWRIKDRQGGGTAVEFSGELDENAALASLKPRLKGPVVFQLGKLRRIAARGAREWVNFVRELPQVTDLQLAECSPIVVSYLNVMLNFRGTGRVTSVYAPYVCSKCATEEEKLIELQEHFPTRDHRDAKKPPEFACSKCGSRMDLDDIAERYLAFLGEK